MPDLPQTESILTSIKKLLGITEEDTSFDADLIIHINTFLTRLVQLGVGMPGFTLVDAQQTWDDFITSDITKWHQAKTYVYLRVRMIFDPPSNGTTAKAFEDNARELEWLLYVDSDNAQYPVDS